MYIFMHTLYAYEELIKGAMLTLLMTRITAVRPVRLCLHGSHRHRTHHNSLNGVDSWSGPRPNKSLIKLPGKRRNGCIQKLLHTIRHKPLLAMIDTDDNYCIVKHYKQ